MEEFATLASVGCRHGFIGRVPGIDAGVDRAAALSRLAEHHREALRTRGLGDRRFVTAEQVHGNTVAVIESPSSETPIPAADGLLTDRRDVCLGIYVADCCAVYLVDRRGQAIGLVHAGKKGAELGIVPAAIEQLQDRFGSQPEDLTVQLSPCIRPPYYEVDFAAEIAAQCRACGVETVSDCGTCTAANPSLYYSYRLEKGRTGRMLAFLALH